MSEEVSPVEEKYHDYQENEILLSVKDFLSEK